MFKLGIEVNSCHFDAVCDVRIELLGYFDAIQRQVVLFHNLGHADYIIFKEDRIELLKLKSTTVMFFS